MKNSNKNLPFLFRVEKCLGPLEHEVMLLIWEMEKVNVRQMVEALRFKKKFAYTTIMTVMDKLYKKRFLKRRKIGRAYWYFPAVKEEVIITNSLSWVFRDLIKDYGRKKVLASTLALLPTFSTKLIKTYKQPVLLGFSFTLTVFLLGYSLFDLWQNLNFFGTIDYLKLLLSGVDWQLLFYALVESLPLINILVSVVLLFLTTILGERLFKITQLGKA